MCLSYKVVTVYYDLSVILETIFHTLPWSFRMQILVAGVPITLNVEGTTSLLSTLIHPGCCTTPVWVSSASGGTPELCPVDVWN